MSDGRFTYQSDEPNTRAVDLNDYEVIAVLLTNRGIKSVVEKWPNGDRTLTTPDHYAGSEGCEFTFDPKGRLKSLKSN